MAIFSRGLQTWTTFLESDVTYNFDKATADLIISAINRIPVIKTDKNNTHYANYVEDEEPSATDIRFHFEEVPTFGFTYLATGSHIVNIDSFGFWNKFRIRQAVKQSRKKFDAEKVSVDNTARRQRQFDALNDIMRELQK